jgi:hypothetical protein
MMSFLIYIMGFFMNFAELQISCVFAFFALWKRVKTHVLSDQSVHLRIHIQGFQSGPVPGTFTRLRSCIVPAEITEPPKISGGENHKYDGR